VVFQQHWAARQLQQHWQQRQLPVGTAAQLLGPRRLFVDIFEVWDLVSALECGQTFSEFVLFLLLTSHLLIYRRWGINFDSSTSGPGGGVISPPLWVRPTRRSGLTFAAVVVLL